MQRRTKQLSQQEINRYTVNLWKIVIGFIAFGVILLFSIGLGLFGKLPSFRDLENPKSNIASEVISDDGNILGTYYVQNRTPVRYDQISPNVINALVSTEDKRFYSHSGLDFKRTFSIIFKNLIGKKEGASTITQQLALNLFSKEGRSRNTLKRSIQKLQEWIVAVKLERQYTKEEIITMYLNTVDFGTYNSFGIKAAARTFFNTTPDKLKPEQAAMLIGMLKGPSLYSPIRNPDNALRRRNTVLNNMYQAGFLTNSEFEEVKEKPIKLSINPTDYSEGSAAYFRAVLKRDIQRIFEEQSITKADGTPYDLDRDGLKIFTSINSKMQTYAEQAQREYLKSLQNQFNQQWGGRDPFKSDKMMQDLLFTGMKRSDRYKQLKAEDKSNDEIWADFRKPAKMTIFSWRGDIDTLMRPIDSIKYYKLMLRNAVMSMEPQTGYVRAWVGGNNFEYFKYDQVKMGARQVGSTAKPFTYAVAIGSQGFSPCYQVPNEPVTVEGWTPKAYKPIPGYLTLRKALANSQNYVTAWVMKQVGATAVSTQIKKMGISTDVPAYPSICLGTFDATLYDMVGAYSTFVNHGLWTEPIYLLRIEDKNGNVLYDRKPQVKVALDPQTAYVMTSMLKSVVNEGTGVRLRYKYNFKNPIGGKTGTTQNNSDGWFIGITPELVTGVWTGCEDRALHFFSTDKGEGANSALPVFALYMKKVYADPSLKYTKGDFEPPKGGVKITLDCDAYGPAKTDSTQTEPQTEELKDDTRF
ncbi:penicillin-binding protein [Pedobacter sp. HMF7647]|uniref:Penicillin-binding protein n=1 Tax=Hufsiella arboris TaxID=2695275 RepID=A0A7K1Y464_9SPHI|nr:transglycosylase domain-containing protein [Hufsiella arboris]MXV49363.1 penicillin-binding protein [Hufsiella arboris]